MCLPTSHGQAQATGAELEPKAPRRELQTQLWGTEAGPGNMANMGWKKGTSPKKKKNTFK